MNWNQLLPYLGPAIVLIIVARRMLRAQEPRRIRPGVLWIQPAMLFAAMIFLFLTTPVQLSPLSLSIFVIGAFAGATIGYFRALHQELSIEPETGNVMSKATPLGSLLFLGIFIVRFAVNTWMKDGQQTDMRHPPSATLMLYTDATLFFAFAMVVATAFEVWRRTRPLVLQRRAEKPEIPSVTPSSD